MKATFQSTLVRKARIALYKQRKLWEHRSQTRSGRFFSTGFRYFITLAIISYLVYQITTVGWLELWRSFPVNPLFYVFFVGIYITLPLIESAIYRHVWNIPYNRILPAVQKKRVYNSDVAGYSGEFYLYMWARKSTRLPDSDIWRTIKDNTIISSMSTTLFAILLLIYFIAAGELNLLNAETTNWAIIGILLIIGILAALLILRKRIFHLKGKTLMIMGSWHASRLLLVNTLQVLQWMVVIPEISLSVWITFLSVKIVINWLPVIPAKDMFFLGASFELSRAMDVSAAGVAGMILVASALNKIINAITFAWFSFSDKERKGISLQSEVQFVNNKY